MWTGSGARAEIHLGFAAIRMDEGTDLGILEFSDSGFQAKLAEGVIGMKVRRLEHGDAFEIDTPNASVSPSDAGEYRIEVLAKTNFTEVVVRSGDAQITNPRKAFEVLRGQRAHVNKSRLMERDIGPAPLADAFDEFCQTRDHVEERAQSLKYAPAGVIGAYDLDDCGIWSTSPALGAYWTPQCVPAGWAPYRFGRWNWIEPWGWTWIDDQPWGFAPFHYGRWTWREGEWSWVPGPSRGQPVYAPALVAFVVGVRGSSLGWFPLGPGEFYVPAYHTSSSYFINLNQTAANPSKIDPETFATQAFANRLVPSAVTAVPRETLVAGGPVEGMGVSLDPHEAAGTKVTGGYPQLAPEARSLSTRAGRGVQVAEPPAASAGRQVIERRTPALPPVPFEQRQRLLEAHPGQPLDRETLDQLRRGASEESSQ